MKKIDAIYQIVLTSTAHQIEVSQININIQKAYQLGNIEMKLQDKTTKDTSDFWVKTSDEVNLLSVNTSYTAQMIYGYKDISSTLLGTIQAGQITLTNIAESDNEHDIYFQIQGQGEWSHNENPTDEQIKFFQNF